jgi:hypothetical protein
MHKLVGFAAGLILAGACLGAEAHAATKRQGSLDAFTGVDEVVFECTTSTSYTQIPQMRRTFTVAGASRASVVVMFQGAFSLSVDPAVTSDTGFIQLQIDGVVQGPGDQVPVQSTQGGGNVTGAHGFNWQSKRLAPGPHIVQIHWRTDQGSNFCVDARSLIILHK